MVDFFINYNKADKKWGDWIANRLELAGYTTLAQTHDFSSNNSFIPRVQQAVANARQVIVILSQHYIHFELSQPEWFSVFSTVLSGEKRNLILIKADHSSPPDLFAHTTCVDLSEIQKESQAENLLLNAIGDKEKRNFSPPYPNNKIIIPFWKKSPETGIKELSDSWHKLDVSEKKKILDSFSSEILCGRVGFYCIDNPRLKDEFKAMVLEVISFKDELVNGDLIAALFLDFEAEIFPMYELWELVKEENDYSVRRMLESLLGTGGTDAIVNNDNAINYAGLNELLNRNNHEITQHVSRILIYPDTPSAIGLLESRSFCMETWSARQLLSTIENNNLQDIFPQLYKKAKDFLAILQ